MLTIIRGGRYGRMGVGRGGVQGGAPRRLPPGAVPVVPSSGEGAGVLRAGISALEHAGRILARVVARLFGETGTVSW